MPDTPVPQHGFDPLRAEFNQLKQRLGALETQQQLVIGDPTGATGDSAHGNAVVVLGNLSPNCGFTPPVFGLAVTGGMLVATDPTGATGDPSHGHATVVIGRLQAITGISASGLAVWNGSAWVQIT